MWTPTSADATWLLANTTVAGTGWHLGDPIYIESFDSRWFLRLSPGGTLVATVGGAFSGIVYTNTTTSEIVLE